MTPEENLLRYDRLLAGRQRDLQNLAEERARVDAAQEAHDAAAEALRLLQAVAEHAQEQAHAKLAGVVEHCLKAVFGPVYGFHLAFERKRSATEARFYFTKGGHEVAPRALGGGVLDVASFALRVAVLAMARPPLRRLIVADEPFRYVSKQYRPRVRALLEALAEEAKIQMVLVTHDSAFEIGEVVEIG